MNLKRSRTPELEHDFVRDATLGYEPEGSYGYVRCLEHGFPNPLVRWHYHEEYELHLIVQTHGKVFVGDYIGHFEPGHLVLTGPRLPHNWISSDVGPEGVAQRDVVLQFSDEPLRRAAELVPELRDVLPLLERARLGIEFFGMTDRARLTLDRIKHLHHRIAVAIATVKRVACRRISGQGFQCDDMCRSEIGDMNVITHTRAVFSGIISAVDPDAVPFTKSCFDRDFNQMGCADR